MISIQGKEYELKFNIGRCKLIEKNLGMSIYGLMERTDGFFTIDNVCSYVRYSLYDIGTSSFMPPDKADGLCLEWIQEASFPIVLEKVINELKEQCPFFFPPDLLDSNTSEETDSN